MEDRLRQKKEVISQKLSIPKELSEDIPKITVFGDSEISIENHKGLIAFNTDEVKINSRLGTIKILGRAFEILYIGGDSITVKGKFVSIVHEWKKR